MDRNEGLRMKRRQFLRTGIITTDPKAIFDPPFLVLVITIVIIVIVTYHAGSEVVAVWRGDGWACGLRDSRC